MKTLELDALASEAASLAVTAASDANVNVDVSPSPSAAENVAALKSFLAPVLGAVGGQLCAAVKVAPLDQAESENLAEAMARVASLYDLGQLSEKQAAWIGLGMTAGAIVIARLPNPLAATSPAPRDDRPAPAADAIAAEPQKSAPNDKVSPDRNGHDPRSVAAMGKFGLY